MDNPDFQHPPDSSLTEVEQAVLSKTIQQIHAILTDLKEIGFTPSDNYRYGNQKRFEVSAEWCRENPTIEELLTKMDQLANAFYSNNYRLFEIATKRLRGPRSFSAAELNRVGVTLLDPSHTKLACQRCGQEYWVKQPPHNKRFPRGYWCCPSGCHDPER